MTQTLRILSRQTPILRSWSVRGVSRFTSLKGLLSFRLKAIGNWDGCRLGCTTIVIWNAYMLERAAIGLDCLVWRWRDH
jgi:hypothetical protein